MCEHPKQKRFPAPALAKGQGKDCALSEAQSEPDLSFQGTGIFLHRCGGERDEYSQIQSDRGAEKSTKLEIYRQF